MFEWFYDFPLIFVFAAAAILFAATTEFFAWIGRSLRPSGPEQAEIGTLTGAALGLLALLLGFSFSLALSRFDDRRHVVLEEANAIGTAANYATMLPDPSRGDILRLLRTYADVRLGLDIPHDAAKLQRDVARSLQLQQALWQQAATATAAAPQSLAAYRFVAALNEMTNIHETRLTALRFHVPLPVVLMLVGVAEVALGFTGYQTGTAGGHRRLAALIMAVTIAAVITEIVDLDRPARGLIQVPVQPLIDARDGIPQ